MKVLTIFSLILFYSCKDDATTSTTVDADSFTSLYSNLFGATVCKNCHLSGGQAFENGATNLDFSTQTTAYSSLTATTAQNPTSETCTGLSFVVANNVNTSYLLAVLSDIYSTNNFDINCTAYDDSNHHSYASDYIVHIENWINNGALND